MTKTTRSTVAGLAFTMARVGAGHIAAAQAAEGTMDVRRVRTSSPALTALIRDADVIGRESDHAVDGHRKS